jgi:hypothetical protein
MKIVNLLTPALLFMLLACDIADNQADPAASFSKIYDDERFEIEYYPLSIIQTSDDGYLILSEVKNDISSFTSAYVLKLSPEGEVEQATLMPDPIGLPVGEWSVINDRYYFVGMNTTTLLAQLIAVEVDGTVGEPQTIGTTYPLAAKQDGNNILLLSFDNQDANSVLSMVSSDGTITQQAEYTIGAGVDVEKPIIDHLTRNGPKIPFAVGNSDNGYYFNGLFNYTFSMVFTNFGDDPTGVCQGQLSLGGISAVHRLNGNNYAVSRYNFGASYINPIVQINSNAVTSSVDLGGNTFPEIESEAVVAIRENTDLGVVVYGTQTNSRRIVLYGYASDNGEITGTQYLGAGNPYLFIDFTFTNDGGIAILSQVALEGRFPRIAIFKRDKNFLLNLK